MSRTWLPFLALLLWGCSSTPAPHPLAFVHRPIGFESERNLKEHYQKHGAEFGNPGIDAYLQMAEDERDEPATPPIEEIKRPDGVTTRYDISTGAFLAFNPDYSIRTFFKPNDGESYFQRQAHR